jgi:uncharacterized membrane protein YdjX (TVP38/TMEM64 family)
MRHYVMLSGAVMAALLLLFGLVQALGVELLVDPAPVLERFGALAALLAVGLLVADVVLPVPSSILMVWLGAAHGWAAGAVLSLVGAIGAAAVAFWLGRRGGPLVDRLVAPPERQRADAALTRWGPLAVAVTRPVPIIAETTALLAGTSPMRWRALLSAAAIGAAPPALLYALAGAAIL